MFGRVLKIESKEVFVENTTKQIQSNLIGYHVVFDGQTRLIGEIIYVDVNYFQIRLIGEIYQNKLLPGFNKFPTINSICRIITKPELELILGNQDIQNQDNLLIGKSSVYDNFNVTVNVNDFFSNHFSIIGNTGSGKSCGVARLIQNLFSNNKKMPENSHFIIFDAYGEYKSALQKINQSQNINIVNYTTSTASISDSNLLTIPIYFLEVDDLAILLNINDSSLLPVLEKTLRYVYIFNGNDEMCKKYKNDILAKSLIELLSSGRTSQQVRDQIIAVLSDYNTDEINLNTTIYQPGYERTLKQCLNIDAQGKMPAIDLVIEFLKKFSELNVDQIEVKPIKYNLDDLYYALEFALISEGTLNNSVAYEKLSQLKIRLHAIINSDRKKYFETNEFQTKDEYIKGLFSIETGNAAQIVNVNFNYIDDRFAKSIVKILCKLLYNYSATLQNRGSFPINILIEEAHRYVNKDSDIEIIGYNIFERIAKEGRKYGVLLGLITQRISELSPMILSQCSNFIIFRIYYPDDIKMIESMVPNITKDLINRVKTLYPGSALLFGNAFKIPLIVNLEIPDPMPTSTNVNLANIWYK